MPINNKRRPVNQAAQLEDQIWQSQLGIYDLVRVPLTGISMFIPGSIIPHRRCR